MLGTFSFEFAVWCLWLISTTTAACYDPSPAFPLPIYDSSEPTLKAAFKNIQDELESLVSNDWFNTTSYSVEVTSSKETIWSSFHTARDRNSSRTGAKVVNGDSAYRIASISKTFTTLGILQEHAKGNLHLDDPITKYISAFDDPQSGALPWKDITLRSLASQLSGIPRDWSQGDILPEHGDPVKIGLPPPSNTAIPHCYAYKNYIPCAASDMFKALKTFKPLFAPNAQSSYSNTAFELLGLVLANVTGMTYEDYIRKSILEPIGMKGASFAPPPDSVAVLPKYESSFWDVKMGVHNPTGGLYASASSMSLYLRYILTHYNGLHTGSNWLQPASFAMGTSSYYGMPWETFRTSSSALLPYTSRPVTFFTKSGGVPGYTSIIILAPEYDLGITLLVAGNGSLLAELRESVTTKLLRAADELSTAQIQRRYTGSFRAAHINSSLTLSHSRAGGLVLQDWISNGTEFLAALAHVVPGAIPPGARAQLVPTLLFEDEEKQRGERWRVLIVPPRPEEGSGKTSGLWDEFCITDVDYLMYDGRPLNEVVFWGDDEKGRVHEVQLTAFRVLLGREGDKTEWHEEHEKGGLVLQEL